VFLADETNQRDVLKIDMFSMSAGKLRQKVIDNLETVPDEWDYSAHLTLGFLDRNCGLWYVGNNPVIGEKVVVDRLVFSPAYGEKKYIYTNGKVGNYANI
jgi:hypothetical protein